MTLCVAAECKRYKRFFHAVVFAADQRVEGEIASAEIGVKFGFLTDESHPVLLAGTETRAQSLAGIIAGVASGRQSPPDQDNKPLDWDSVLNDSVLFQKRHLAQEIVGPRFGLTYEQFLAAKASLPDDIFRETVLDIARTPLDCWLLVVAFTHNDPRIYRIGDTGMVEACQNFAAIGSGYYLAEASLFQRSQNRHNDLGTTIYNVYEAMKLGAIAPGVGNKFTIGIAEWDWYEQPNPYNRGEVKISFLTPEYYEYLAAQFKKLGPKEVTSINVKPRFIKERDRSLVLTPKGEVDPKIQRDIERTRIAREREARKRAAKQSVSQTSAPKP
jgi:hypothetical protein